MKKTYTAHMRHVAFGIAGSLAILGIYFAIVGTLQGMSYAVGRLFGLWYLMFPLVIGFGFQIGLFSCLRSAMRMSPGSSVASGGVSTVSMIACCAHHLTDVIPFIGMSALGLFLLQYQQTFLVLGIVSNIVGIVLMMNIAKKSGMKFKNSFFRSIMKSDLGKLVKILSILGGLAIVVSFILSMPVQSGSNSNSNSITLNTLSDNQNSVTVDVIPYPLSANNPVKFQISLNTHSVSLDFDLAKISTLVADGKEFIPVSWEGSPLGGHHRSGVLTFPKLNSIPRGLKLVIRGVAGEDWLFEWNT